MHSLLFSPSFKKKQKILDSLHLLASWSSYLFPSSVSLVIITVSVFKKHLWHHFNVPQTEIRPLISCLRINVIFFPSYITYASPEHYVGLSADFLTICSQMTQHLHLALQQLTLWFMCQLLLLVPPAVPHLYILYVSPWVEITIPLLLFSLCSTHILVSSPDSLMQPKTWLNPVSELCPTNTHTHAHAHLIAGLL